MDNSDQISLKSTFFLLLALALFMFANSTDVTKRSSDAPEGTIERLSANETADISDQGTTWPTTAPR